MKYLQTVSLLIFFVYLVGSVVAGALLNYTGFCDIDVFHGNRHDCGSVLNYFIATFTYKSLNMIHFAVWTGVYGFPLMMPLIVNLFALVGLGTLIRFFLRQLKTRFSKGEHHVYE